MSCDGEKGVDKDQSISDLRLECCDREKRIDTEDRLSSIRVEGCGGGKGNAKEQSKEVEGAGLEGKDQENGNVGGTEEEVRAGVEEEEEEEERDVNSEQEEVFRDRKRVGRGARQRKEECVGLEKGIRVRGLCSQNYVRLSNIYVYVSS